MLKDIPNENKSELGMGTRKRIEEYEKFKLNCRNIQKMEKDKRKLVSKESYAQLFFHG